MKTRLLSLFAVFALLLVSTAALADGRPTGIRISRAANGGNNNVEIDVTVTGTDRPWNTISTTIWLGNVWSSSPTITGYPIFQYASNNFSVPLPPGVDWGDGSTFNPTLFGPPGGPWQGTFAHTYGVPGSYTITVGKAMCCVTANNAYAVTAVNTGNLITGTVRYVSWNDPNPSPTTDTFSEYYPTTTNGALAVIAVTANVAVATGTGIPALNIYGLLAMAFVLVGAGLLVFRRPQRSAI